MCHRLSSSCFTSTYPRDSSPAEAALLTKAEAIYSAHTAGFFRRQVFFIRGGKQKSSMEVPVTGRTLADVALQRQEKLYFVSSTFCRSGGTRVILISMVTEICELPCLLIWIFRAEFREELKLIRNPRVVLVDLDENTQGCGWGHPGPFFRLLYWSICWLAELLQRLMQLLWKSNTYLPLPVVKGVKWKRTND